MIGLRPTADDTARALPVAWLLTAVMLVTLPASSQASGDASASATPPPQPSRYPTTSMPVAGAGEDPLHALAEPPRKSARLVPEGAPVLSVWAGAAHYEVPEPVDFFAHVVHEGRAVEAASIRGTLVDDRAEDLAEVVFRDDGVAPDAEAGDRVYSVRFAVPPELHPPLGAHVLMIRVVAKPKDRTAQRASVAVTYGRSGGRLTGVFRDRLVDGNLVIAAEVEVETEARFHLEGVIYGKDGVAIGNAQRAAVLAPGRHELSLSFYGLMFVQRQLPGPYVLGSVMLRTTAPPAAGSARGPVLRDAHTTAPYALDALNHREYAGPDAQYVVPVPPFEGGG